jgi:hypothetical protein
LFAFHVCLALTGILACKDDPAKVAADNPPPPPPPSASTKPNVCASGGGEVKDVATKDVFPRSSAGYCVDPNGDAMVYGDKEKHTMDEVCTKEFDGECEVYKRLGIKRVVTLRYVDGSGQSNTVQVLFDQFADAGGAYAMFTTRVVAGADPLAATMKPMAGGGAAAIGSTNALVWKGPYLLELSFGSDDPSMTKEKMTELGQTVCGALAKAIGDKIPGASDKLPAVKALPDANMLPLGVVYQPKDALGVAGLGAAAVGYYKDGDKRWRTVVLLRDDNDQARDAMKLIKGKPGAYPMKDIADDAVAMVVQEAPDRAKSDYVFARKGNVILAIGDEELVLKTGEPAEKSAPFKLTRDEKLVKLRAWALAPAPAASSASPAASASAAPKK